MDQSYRQDRYLPAVIAVIVIANAIILFSSNFLPFIDLPNHLAEATIYQHERFSDENQLSEYYAPTPWFYPNTFHPVFCSLFSSVETGNQAFHLLYIILLQIGLFLVIRELQGNQWYGLLGTLFTYNYNVTFGFVGFAISTSMLILLLYLTILDIRKNKVTIKVGIAATLVIIFLMHAQNALLGLLIYGFLMLFHLRRSFGRLVLHGILVPLPLILFIFAWWTTREAATEQSTGKYLIEYYLNDFLKSLSLRPRIIVFDNFQLFEGVPGILVAAVIFSMILIPILWLKPKQKLFDNNNSNLVYAGIFLGVNALCYLLLPDKLPGQTPLFQRFCTITILAFIIFASVWLSESHWRWLRVYVLSCAAIYFALWFQYIHAFNRLNGDFTKELFTDLSTDGTLAGLIYDNSYRGRKVFIHYPNYFLVWKQGPTASKIIDYRFGVVRRVANHEEIPFYHELIGDHYKPLDNYRPVEYLLVRGKAPVKEDLNLEGFRLSQRSGHWRIYVRSAK